LAKFDLPLFVNDLHIDTKVTLDQEAFYFGLARSPHLSFNYPLGEVYELLQDI
jgi:hypothetical protein